MLPVVLLVAAGGCSSVHVLSKNTSINDQSAGTVAGNVAGTAGAKSTSNTAVISKTKAQHCKGDKRVYDKGLQQSQTGEDRELLWSFGFDQICGGTYLEMGGFTGIHFSNSYVFHKALDWKGVMIEASPTNYEQLIKNRPDEIATVNAGVCDDEKDLHWVNTRKGAVSGFVEFAAESFKEQWWSENDIKNAKLVKCRTLKNVLLEAVGENYFFDFFSLDIEGAELMALMSIEFDLVSFGVIFVEADKHNEAKNTAVKMHLAKNGYAFVKNTRGSDWFVNMNFEEIYKDIIIKGLVKIAGEKHI